MGKVNLRRSALKLLATPFALSVPLTSAFAQDKKTVRLLVGFPAASISDIVARLIAPHIGTALGRNAIVEVKAGADGQIAAQDLIRQSADGSSLFVATNSPLQAVPAMRQPPPYDPVTDFSHIGYIGRYVHFLLVTRDLPFSNVNELFAYAKANPGKVRYGSSGPGSASHLAGELFSSMAGVTLLHVPYKGTGQALTDLLAGHIDLMFAPAQTVMPQIESGKLLALAQTGAKRSEALPNIPTVAEAGLPAYSAVGWFGLFAPANTPKATVQKINQTVMFVLGQEKVRKAMLERGSDPASGSAEEFAAFLRLDQSKWTKLIKDNKVAVQ